MNWLRNRLKERTTWIGLLAFAGLFGVRIRPELQEAIITAAVAVIAAIEIICKEKPDDLPASDSPDQRTERPPIELQARPDSANHRRRADPDPDLDASRRVVSAAGDSTDELLGGVRAPMHTPSERVARLEKHDFTSGFNDR